MDQMAGKQSVRFRDPVKIAAYAAVAGKKEGEGPLGRFFDRIVEDPMFGQENWEESESCFLKTAAETAMKKGGFWKEDIRMAFCGDLLGQLIASSFGMAQLGIPYYGVYGACASIGAALSMAAAAVNGGCAKAALAACSSHFASAEKEFRFPLGYGSQRPYSATWTVTGSGAFVLGGEKSGKEGGKEGGDRAEIRGFTTGKIRDYGMADPFNMGACMAPAAADTIDRSLADFAMEPNDFDRIITGDLGAIGQQLLFDLLDKNNRDIRKNHMDCGMQIFDGEKQDTHAGGSGCACSALVLASLILPKLEKGEWKRVLFVPTGALLSQVSANEGRTIPGVAHAVWLESCSEPGSRIRSNPAGKSGSGPRSEFCTNPAGERRDGK